MPCKKVDGKGKEEKENGKKETDRICWKERVRLHKTSRTEFGQQMRSSELLAYLSLYRL